MALQLDLVLEEDNCNLRCDYCAIRMKPTVTREILDIGAMLDLVAKAREIAPAPIVRLSGGEVFLYRNLIEFLRELRTVVPVVEIVTNGTFLDEAVTQALAAIGNVHIRFSLDGHCYEMNAQRFRSDRVFQKVYRHFQGCVAAELGLSIFCVVSRDNSQRLVEFVDVVNELARPVPLYFLPVRHVYGTDIRPDSQPFTRLSEAYADYQNVLFSKSYVDSLARFVGDQARSLDCFAQKQIVGLNQDGDVFMCPCGFPGSRGNVHEGAISAPLNGIRHGYCKGCYTDYDVLSLFAKGQVTLQELGKDRVYRNPAVRKALLQSVMGPSVKG